MNTPGPIYTARSDFALLGPTIAPEFVSLDDEQVDVVFRQPITEDELNMVLAAADDDPFDGYALDGNANWTVEAVRDWWRRVPDIRRHIEVHLLETSWYPHASEAPLIKRVGIAWASFLDSSAESYLREYCHFLASGEWPRPDARLDAL